MLFELNCDYYSYIYCKKDTNLYFQSKTGNELSVKLQKLMTICQKNVYHAQKLQKQAQNKGAKPKNYATSDNVWLNSKYIKIK